MEVSLDLLTIFFIWSSTAYETLYLFYLALIKVGFWGVSTGDSFLKISKNFDVAFFKRSAILKMDQIFASSSTTFGCNFGTRHGGRNVKIWILVLYSAH